MDGYLMRKRLILVSCTALLALSACGDQPLRVLGKPGEGPDEFRIVPGKPLTQPDSYATLPPPAPEGTNRTDQDPLGDSIVALGGRRSDPNAGVPASDGALVAHAGRYGATGNIRAVLLEEDEAYRASRGRLTWLRLPGVDRYVQVYEPQALDAAGELRRWRRAGAATPSAPLN